MNPANPCPKCGAELAPGGALKGLCPRCLLDRGAAAGEETHDLEAVRAQFPELDVEEVLGRGGMGVVFRARQRRLDRVVALKLLAPELARDPSFAERFVREARALARLNHPNIVGVYDFGERDGLFYLLLEFVDGVGLRDVLRAGSLGAREALALVPEICSGLQYAHERGVVHRDVKPENLLLDRDGHVKIADFGLAKIVAPGEQAGALTRTSQVMGTPHYIAPEQIRTPLAVDHRADIYSLGVVLYEMLTGDLPLGPFEPPARRLGLDVRLDDVVLKTLEREPDRRYQRADHVATDVEGIASGVGGRAGADSRGARSADENGARWYERLPGGAPAVAITALLLAWLWGVFVRSQGLHVQFLAVSYPLAYVALHAARTWRTTEEQKSWRGVLMALAGTACVVSLAITCSLGSEGIALVFVTLAAALAFASSFGLERWVFETNRAAAAGFVVLMLIATIVQSTQASSPGREAYYFSSGVVALLGAGPVVLLAPDLVMGHADRPRLECMARAAALSLVGAAFFFHRQIF